MCIMLYRDAFVCVGGKIDDSRVRAATLKDAFYVNIKGHKRWYFAGV